MKTCVITGGASGIGLATAEAAVKEGYITVLVDKDPARLETALARLQCGPGKVVGHQLDVSDSVAVEEFWAGIGSTLGAIDCLVTAAGYSEHSRGWDVSADSWDKMLRVHLGGTFLCCREAARLMLRNGGGSIVTVSSEIAFRGGADAPHYAAAKGGIVGLTKSLALALAPKIRVNSVAPGSIDTPLWRGNLSDAELEGKMRERSARIPIGRVGEPEDVAAAIMFLLSPRSRYMTGQVLHINGGRFMAS